MAPVSSVTSQLPGVGADALVGTEKNQSTYARWGATIKVMFRQTLHTARPAAAGVLRAAAFSSFSDARLVAAAVPSATDTALAAAAAVAAGGARG